MIKYLDYGYIAITMFLTVYTQLILKWRLSGLGPAPSDIVAKFKFLFLSIFDPFIFSAYAAGFLASLTWMAALTKFDVSHAFPFTSLNFALVLLFGVLLLNEPLSMSKVVGVALIVSGTLFLALDY